MSLSFECGVINLEPCYYFVAIKESVSGVESWILVRIVYRICKVYRIEQAKRGSEGEEEDDDDDDCTTNDKLR